tara:strand:+ start:819 stop:1100 length:282 start_codon:yes stop_codon:yes gene_type:complete
MNFYKKTIFIFLVVVLSFVFFIKLIEPVIEKQMTNIFADKKLSKKLSRELISSTEEFTPEKRLFYKNIIKKLYLKWVPLIEEAKREAELELKK